MKNYFTRFTSFLISTGAIFLCTNFLLSCNNEKVLPKQFSLLDSSTTHINFANNLDSSKNFRALYFFYYYNGGGVATGDINNDGLVDIYFTANSKGNNKLFLNKGNMQFEDITASAGVAGNSDWCTGVTMADVNADGYLDIYVSSLNNIYNFRGHNELFINKGNGVFTESAAQYGLDLSAYANQAAFFDYDHDGDLDCYLLNESFKPNETLSDTGRRKIFDANSGDRLFRNDINKTGKFVDVSAQSGIYQGNVGYGLGLAVADLNNDGWDDIYIGNDFQENDYCYLNNGHGAFVESGAKMFNHYSRFSMGNDIADYNNDGQPDIFTADMLPQDEKILKSYGSGEDLATYDIMFTKNGYQNQYSKNCLQRNNGDGKSFSETALLSGVSATDWSWCPLFADFDNDGNKDLFITSGIVKRTVDLDYIRFLSNISFAPGEDKKVKYNEALKQMPDGISHNYMFKGNGNLQFADISNSCGFEDNKGYFNGAAYADFDNDGDLDIAVNPINATAFIYQNNSLPKNFLNIQFKGDSLNSFGVGTKVYVFQKNKLQYQQLMSTRGFQSASFSNLHFGLDSVASVDSILIVWTDYSYQVLKKPAVNKLLLAQKKDAAGKFEYNSFFPPKRQRFYSTLSLLEKPWQHKEDPVFDFSAQYLMPHALSIRGPKLAVADVNKDGLDDFYACGAAGQAGQLFIQKADGKFVSSDTIVFSADAKCEDVDAVFFDANGDSYPDLYVVSGGNKLKGNGPALLDRLYLNDEEGHFTKAQTNLPPIFTNKSCVSVADIEGDGDTDIFIGNLADPQSYGLPQTSYLLLNDGKGNFAIANDKIINLQKIGMVTAAAFADVNKDGKNDLIIAGEWMPVTVYLNEGNKFAAHALDSGGLWQSLKIADINNDGYPDILAGNWGLNCKLVTGKNGPLKLYVKDFDGSGRTEPLLAYTIDNKEYSFLPKDEIEQVLPFLKKKYLLYTDFAGKTMQEVFDLKTGNTLELKATDLSSAIFINDGKGNFRRINFPPELQLSPLFAFERVKNSNAFITGGNFFGVRPYEGQYDAASLISFSFNNNNQVQQTNVVETKEQVRDLEWVHTENSDVLLVARNNGSILFYSIRK